MFLTPFQSMKIILPHSVCGYPQRWIVQCKLNWERLEHYHCHVQGDSKTESFVLTRHICYQRRLKSQMGNINIL